MIHASAFTTKVCDGNVAQSVAGKTGSSAVVFFMSHVVHYTS